MVLVLLLVLVVRDSLQSFHIKVVLVLHLVVMLTHLVVVVVEQVDMLYSQWMKMKKLLVMVKVELVVEEVM